MTDEETDEFEDEFEEEFDEYEPAYEPEYDEPVLEWWERHRSPVGYHVIRIDPEYIDGDGNEIPEDDPRRRMIRVVQGSHVYEGPLETWNAMS